MKKEYTFVAIIGMFLLSYLLDAVVDPLNINLATPYEYFTQGHFNSFPFTSASIIIRSLAILLTPVWLAWFVPKAYPAKAVTLLVLSVLIQLYAVQDVVSGAHVVPLEWSIALAIGGAAILLPTVWYFILSALSSAHHTMLAAVTPPPPPGKITPPDWLSNSKTPSK